MITKNQLTVKNLWYFPEKVDEVFNAATLAAKMAVEKTGVAEGRVVKHHYTSGYIILKKILGLAYVKLPSLRGLLQRLFLPPTLLHNCNI